MIISVGVLGPQGAGDKFDGAFSLVFSSPELPPGPSHLFVVLSGGPEQAESFFGFVTFRRNSWNTGAVVSLEA